MNALQERILSIFKQIDVICRKNNIPYYAIGGTCLGAVRHQGFIPWDDDIDIAVPIEHFDRLQEVLKKELPENLKLYTPKEIHHNPILFIKVMDINTAFCENSLLDWPEAYKGVYIDIMPISGVPKPGLERKLFLKKLIIYSRLNIYRRFLHGDSQFTNRKKRKLMTPFLFGFSYHYFYDKYIKALKKYPLFESDYTGYVWWPTKLKDRIIDAKSFKRATFLPFEDIAMSCPENYDAFLTNLFGDYKKMPSEGERKSTHLGIVDLEKSYTYYQKNGIKINYENEKV